MTINSLIKKLKLLGIDPKKVLGYEMDDYFHDCMFFIRKYEKKWQVFNWERGQVYDLIEFSRESDALIYIYKEIEKDIAQKKDDSSWKRNYGIDK